MKKAGADAYRPRILSIAAAKNVARRCEQARVGDAADDVAQGPAFVRRKHPEQSGGFLREPPDTEVAIEEQGRDALCSE